MITPKLILATGLFFNFAACASTNNGGHVVGNPILSESVSTKMKTDDAPPVCACANSKDAKVKASCKCATDATTSTATSTSTKTKSAPPCKGDVCTK